MRELIVTGAGVAGSYLHALLSERYPELKLQIYDGAKKRGCQCAFGCFYSLLREKLAEVHLNVEDYILCKNRGLILNGVYFDLMNQISIDKPRLIRDLCPQVISKNVDVASLVKGSGWAVNATGTPLTGYHVIPTVQYRARLSGLEPAVNYIHIDPKYVGYGWAFSLDEEGRWFHLGAGCVNADPEILIRALIKRYDIDVKLKTCSCSRPVRIVNPENFIPATGKVISIGEAGGYVFPVTAEGIIPSMDSAENLVKCLSKSPWDDAAALYAAETERYFKTWNYDKAFKVWRLMDRYPRTAWLYGFRYMLSRARKRAQPRITPLKMLKTLLKMSLGGRI
jgi:flavin-dependent dehydrogenase